MAEVEFLFQDQENDIFHGEKLNELISLKNLELAIFNVAFLRSNGVSIISRKIKLLPDPKVLHCFIGIRNGITSVQGLNDLLKLGVNLYAVDTSSTAVIYHPKIYLSKNKYIAKAIVGSANLTFQGLYNNIEGGVLITMDPSLESDSILLEEMTNRLLSIRDTYPDNVIPISSARQLINMLKDGVLTDERVQQEHKGIIISSETGVIPIIPAIRPSHSRNITLARKKRILRQRKIKMSKNIQKYTWELVWKSRALTERDLNIPSGDNTHPTGSMTMKKGAMEDIDQRHYFYEEVFNDIEWNNRNGLLYATANFEFSIAGIYYGSYLLEIKHDPRTTTKSYRQRNAMTHLKWGEAKTLVSQPNLLGRVMKLYRNTGDSSRFLIEID